MKYLVNGTIVTREELINMVSSVAEGLDEEKAPIMLRMWQGPEGMARAIKNHACKIARDFGWQVEVVK